MIAIQLYSSKYSSLQVLVKTRNSKKSENFKKTNSGLCPITFFLHNFIAYSSFDILKEH